MIFLNFHEKIPRHIFVASFGWICRVINAVIQVISIPLILHFLGMTDYAVFAVITGLITWYNLADVGLGPSIQNEISSMRVAGADFDIFLNSIAIYIIALGLIEVIIFSFAAFFLQGVLLRQINAVVPSYLLAVIGSMYILVAVFSVSARIFFAKQKGHLGYLYQSIGIIFGFLVVLIIIFFHTQNRILGIMLGWTVPQVIAAIVGFLHAMPHGGWIKSSSFKRFREILSTAWQFSFNSLGAAFVLGLDYIIMSQIISADDIVIYNIVNKIFTFIFFGYNAILLALWPSMAENYVSGNELKIKEANEAILKNILIGSAYIFVVSVIVIITKDFIMHYFSNSTLSVSVLVIALFSLYYIIRVWSDTYTVAILSRNKIAFIIATIPFQAIVSVIFMYYFGSKFGLVGIILGMVLCFSLTSLWIMPCYHYYLLRRFKRIS